MNITEFIVLSVACCIGSIFGNVIANHYRKPTTITVQAPQTAVQPPQVKAEDAAYDKVKFRVCSDGTRFKCQQDRGYGWVDDVFGGYFATYEEALERNRKQREFWIDFYKDQATQKNFKEVR